MRCIYDHLSPEDLSTALHVLVPRYSAVGGWELIYPSTQEATPRFLSSAVVYYGGSNGMVSLI